MPTTSTKIEREREEEEEEEAVEAAAWYNNNNRATKNKSGNLYSMRIEAAIRLLNSGNYGISEMILMNFEKFSADIKYLVSLIRC